jgi:hypothetical protein
MTRSEMSAACVSVGVIIEWSEPPPVFIPEPCGHLSDALTLQVRVNTVNSGNLEGCGFRLLSKHVSLNLS